MDEQVTNKTIHRILHRNNLTPLLISSLKYSSPVSIDITGIGTILDKLLLIIKTVAWQGKAEKQNAELDIKAKEFNLQRLMLENQKLTFELFEKELEVIEKVKNIKLSPEIKKKLLIELQNKTHVFSKTEINPHLFYSYKENRKGLPEPKDNNQLSAGDELD